MFADDYMPVGISSAAIGKPNANSVSDRASMSTGVLASISVAVLAVGSAAADGPVTMCAVAG